jgi:hypothetical protein
VAALEPACLVLPRGCADNFLAEDSYTGILLCHL